SGAAPGSVDSSVYNAAGSHSDISLSFFPQRLSARRLGRCLLPTGAGQWQRKETKPVCVCCRQPMFPSHEFRLFRPTMLRSVVRSRAWGLAPRPRSTGVVEPCRVLMQHLAQYLLRQVRQVLFDEYVRPVCSRIAGTRSHALRVRKIGLVEAVIAE